MKQARPSFDVFLPVGNIGKDKLSRMEAVLDQDEEHGLAVKPKLLHRVLAPAQSPRAKIVTAEELANVHEALDLGKMDQNRRQQLGIYIGGVLRSFFGDTKLSVPTRSPKLKPFNNGKLLSVAQSNEVAEGRSILKRALPAFYKVGSIPDEVWLDDKLATSVWLGQSDGPASSGLLEKLWVELNCDDTLLEARTEIGGSVKVQPNPSLIE